MKNKILVSFLAFMITLIGLNGFAAYFPKTTLTGFDADSPAIDAFDRQRISDPYTIFDSKQLLDIDGVFYWSTKTNGTGSAIYNQIHADTEMNVFANGDYAVRQTKARFNYQPSKSQMIFTTFTMDGTTGTQTRIGYYNSNIVAPYTGGTDGIFFERSNGTNYMVIANNGTSEERVPQASWNMDKLNGAGASGITLDVTKSQIFFIDFEWLGVGRVRVGFVFDGLITYVHEFNHANNFQDVYMASPNHSVRYAIRSTGGTGSLHHICSAVVSEGGSNPKGVNRAWEATNTYTIGTTDKNVLVLAMRLKTNAVTSTFELQDIHMIAPSLGAEGIKWELVLNPSYSATMVWEDVPSSSMQMASSPNAVTTGGTIIATGYFSGASDILDDFAPSTFSLGMTIDGILDQYVLRVSSISANGDAISTAVCWKELQ